MFNQLGNNPLSNEKTQNAACKGLKKSCDTCGAFY